MTENVLMVQTDSARGFLQSADRFRTAHAVIWEYVSNSLQYIDQGIIPSVIVSINERKKTVSIADNGSGMNRDDLDHFFTMNAENRERRKGIAGRGMWGTGKSAALAIGNELTVTTIRDHKLNSAMLSRTAIENAKGLGSFPVEHPVRDKPSKSDNGTVILISGLHAGPVDRKRLIQHIELELALYPETYSVFVDRHECKFQKPEVETTHKFTPSSEEQKLLGDIELVIEVSKSPLDEELQGIRISSHENWHTTSLGTSSGKKMTEYLFGTLDIPALEDYSGPTSPFDNTRDGYLNPKNDVVAAMFRFIGPAIEKVRRGLDDRRRELAKGEEAKRLARQAEKVADILSRDFKDFQVKLIKAERAAAGRDLGTSYSPLGSDDPGGPWTEGGDELARKDSPEYLDNDPTDTDSEAGDPPNIPSEVIQDSTGQTTGSPTGGGGSKSTRRGGFSVEYSSLGEHGSRGRYVKDGRKIIINTDHPEIAAARLIYEVEDQEWIRLTHEAAIAEYAAALAQELIENKQVETPEEALFEVRQTITRVSAHLAELYNK